MVECRFGKAGKCNQPSKFWPRAPFFSDIWQRLALEWAAIFFRKTENDYLRKVFKGWTLEVGHQTLD
jgi:hypothetical protein